VRGLRTSSRPHVLPTRMHDRPAVDLLLSCLQTVAIDAQPLLKLGAVASFHPHYSLLLARPAVDDASAHQQIVLMVVGGIGKSGEIVIDLNYTHRETGT
jgi:hypothetical protein